MQVVVNTTCHHRAAPTMRPTCGDGKGDYPAPRSNGPTLHKLSVHVASSGRLEKVPEAPGASQERVALLLCCSPPWYREALGSGVCFLRCCGKNVVLQKNSLNPPKPDRNSCPCKLEQKQLKAWKRLEPEARCQPAQRWACCTLPLLPTHAPPEGLQVGQAEVEGAT